MMYCTISYFISELNNLCDSSVTELDSKNGRLQHTGIRSLKGVADISPDDQSA